MHSTIYHSIQTAYLNNTEFKHAGVKGMKWGVRKSETREQKTARREHQSAMKYQKKKQRILESDNAQKILKNKRMFSTQELRTAVDRINVTNQLRNAQENKESTRKKRISNLVGYVALANAAYSNGGKLHDGIKDRVKKKATEKAAEKAFDFMDVEFTESPFNPGKKTMSTALSLYEGLS